MFNHTRRLKASPGQADTISNKLTKAQARDLIAQSLGVDPSLVIIDDIAIIEASVPEELVGEMGRMMPGGPSVTAAVKGNDPYTTIADVIKAQHDDGALHHDGPQPPATPYPYTPVVAKTVHSAVEDRVKRAEEQVDGLLAEVRRELLASVRKHAPMHSPHEGRSVIDEELDELWDEVKADRGYQSSARKEAVQVAAMGVRYLLDLDPGRTRF